ncbi:amino acid synthesis family protein [Shinella lacus]|uniref:Amino acid synthesis family protein n=1 Tax=Shinella lacus TaxID=2654216 RepID=A0ABT1RBK3_9HYPH|nr:amino acid synthesis family protein [Shinella lacus]MCQ4632502.1 amino acid synthesis family protein [Shinella lacus]
MAPAIRKFVTFIEETFIEGGRHSDRPVTAVGVVAILENPWANQPFVDDLTPIINAYAPILGEEMTRRLVALLPAERIEAYGKCAAVGLNGEVEHGSALIHTLRFGNIFRHAAQGTSYLSFANTRNAAGALLSLPMTHKSVTGTRSHFLTLNLQVADAPRENEILIAIGASDGGRPHARIGDRFRDMEEMGIKA